MSEGGIPGMTQTVLSDSRGCIHSFHDRQLSIINLLPHQGGQTYLWRVEQQTVDALWLHGLIVTQLYHRNSKDNKQEDKNNSNNK